MTSLLCGLKFKMLEAWIETRLILRQSDTLALTLGVSMRQVSIWGRKNNHPPKNIRRLKYTGNDYKRQSRSKLKTPNRLVLKENCASDLVEICLLAVTREKIYTQKIIAFICDSRDCRVAVDTHCDKLIIEIWCSTYKRIHILLIQVVFPYTVYGS